MKKLFIALVVVALMTTPALAKKSKKAPEAPPYTQYERGFNDALDSIVLLSMELNIKDEQMTWKEMMNICREKHDVQVRPRRRNVQRKP